MTFAFFADQPDSGNAFSGGSTPMPTKTDEVITWLIVGALAGSLAGMIVKGRRAGFGRLINLGIGLVGALIGGVLFKVLHIDLGLVGAITITSEEVVASFIGSLVFLAFIGCIRVWRSTKSETIKAGNPPKS
jgi:uncharacterized membrane protein YeaQ/YmgE (transglycosylase-associated protein family)